LLDSTYTVEDFASVLALTEDEITEVKSSLESAPPSVEEVENDEEGIAFHIQHGYTKEEVIEISISPNHMDTLIAQYIALEKNVLEAMTMPISHKVPILVFRADLIGHLEGDELERHEKYCKDHMIKLGEHTKLVIIKGSTHSDIYYHSDYREVISSEIDKFLG